MAGGKGTRFRPYSDLVIKPMLPVGPDGYPLLHYIVAWLRRHGIREIVILAGYKWRQIYNYFRDGRCHGVSIRYSLDDDRYRGTGGALVKAYREGLLGSGTVLVWYGDILAPLDVEALLRSHWDAGADATVAVSRGYRVPVGVAEVGEEMNIVGLREKPVLPISVTIGILALEAPTLGEVRGGRVEADIMSDLIPGMISRGRRVRAYIHEGPWYDVGSLERYVKLPIDELRELFEEATREE